MLDSLPDKIHEFQQVLQEITSDLMDSNLFQLKSSTFHKTYRWVLVT